MNEVTGLMNDFSEWVPIAMDDRCQSKDISRAAEPVDNEIHLNLNLKTDMLCVRNVFLNVTSQNLLEIE